MSALAAQTYLTPAEYIDVERKAVTKSEYLSGQIVAMSGASNAHNIITMNEDVVPATSIECELLLGHVYRRVTFSD